VLSGEVADGMFCRAAARVAMPSASHRGPAQLGFRPEHAELVEPSTSGSFAGEIYVVEPLGNETLVTVDVGEALVNIRQPADFSMPVGSPCGVRPIARHLHLFDAETGQALKTGLQNAA
jgi:multiple sugar transport system ATP-binding protein